MKERLIKSWAKIDTLIGLDAEKNSLHIEGIDVPEKIYGAAKAWVSDGVEVRLSVGERSRRTGDRYIYLRVADGGDLIARAKIVREVK